MPVVLRWKSCKFFFFSNEGDLREPLHVHVRCHGARAKFWLGPVAVAENIGFAVMWVTLADGRKLGVPLAYFPRLLAAAPEQRQHYEFSGGGTGIH